MKFVSTKGSDHRVDFREALFQGLAPDGGLYVPEKIPSLPASLFSGDSPRSFHRIGIETLSIYVHDIPSDALERIITSAWDFPVPLVPLEDRIFLLELFHGPTFAFKDVGARFMAHAMSYYLEKQQKEVVILVATSGDTGSAVAHGFFNVPHIKVYVLYPSGKISRLQEQQMTTLGGNIRALEVEGTFDDCQRLVKDALADRELCRGLNVTTANSINVGRLIPQSVYYIWGYVQWRRCSDSAHEVPTVVVPSGNFGNLTAAVYARWMGMPVRKFVAATNVNDVVPHYLATGHFMPRPSVQTLSNAMDVGNPSNLARLQALYKNDIGKMKADIEAESILDEDTIAEIRRTYERTGQMVEPHTAVGVAAARRLRSAGRITTPCIIAATAHPAKFPDVIERATGIEIALPLKLREALDRPKQSTQLPADYRRFKDLLTHTARC